jgi:hypothetical protein
MNILVVSWIISLVAIVIFFTVHFFVAHWLRPKDPFILLNRLFPLFLLFSLIFAYRINMSKLDLNVSPAKGFIESFCIFFFLFLCYLSFYALIEHAVRARIAIELYRNSGKPLLISQLLQNYDPRTESKRRLDELTIAGFLSCEDNRYRLTNKGRMFAQLALFSKRVFNLRNKSV